MQSFAIFIRKRHNNWPQSTFHTRSGRGWVHPAKLLIEFINHTPEYNLRKMHTPMALTAIAFAAATLTLQMSAAMAQTAPPAKTDSAVLNLDEVVITATPEGRSKMKQSQSVSTLNGEQILQSNPSSAAEVLRSIPGVRSEASSGDGNANITVRGVPISAGGSRYVQLQEDGLPIMLMGDFNFLTADMFTRVDFGTDGVEVVRGGGASTLASNSPGGVINFLSKTGEVQGGSIGLSYGSHGNLRTDFNVGGPMSDTTRYNVSGFVRNGQGPRDTGGLIMEQGYQLRANMTKDLGAGSYVRFNAKILKDKSPTLLTVPVQIVNQQIVAAPGVDPRTYTPYSSGLPLVPNWGQYNSGSQNVNDGLSVESLALGAEFSINLGNDWTLKDSFRINRATGIFSGVMPADSIAAPFTSYTGLFLGSKFRDVGSTFNDLKLTKSFKLDATSSVNTTAGLFYGSQRYDQDWEIGGFNGMTTSSPGAAAASYTSYFKRSANMTYTQLAPYAALAYQTGPLNLDASLRMDSQTAKGNSQAGTDPLHDADYTSKYTSFSLGANYSLNKDMSVFGRVSNGAALNSDRILFAAAGPCTSCFTGKEVPVNKVQQMEVGMKMRSGNLSTFVTLFQAKTDESNYDLTNTNNPVTTQNKYDASGVEIEAGYKMGMFRINGGLTYTNASVTDSNNLAYIGKTPNRQAKVIYQLAPSLNFGNMNVGMSFIGTTASRDAQTSAFEAELPGYVYSNLFFNMDVNKSWNVGFAVNNVFDTIGYTEVNSDRAAARSINGRTVKFAAKYNF
jgi:outer membrane receptor protein involved in Fe transport